MTRVFLVVYLQFSPEKNPVRRSIILIDKHPIVWSLETRKPKYKLIDSWTEVLEKDVPSVLKALENNYILTVDDYGED